MPAPARGAAGEQLHRTVGAGGPHEVAADRAAELEKVAHAQQVGEVRRDFPFVQTLPDQLDPRSLRRRGEGVAALRGVAIGGGRT